MEDINKKLFLVLFLGLFLINLTSAFTFDSDIVSYWHFDETTGTTAYDAVGSNDGSIGGATLGVDGILNTAFGFESPDYVNVTSVLNTNVDQTWVAWIKTSDLTTTEQTIISKSGAGWASNSYTLQLDNTGELKVHMSGGEVVSTSGANIQEDTWYMITFTSNTSGSRIYVNDELKGSSSSYMSQSNTYNMLIGQRQAFSNSFDGSIDEVMVLDDTLSSTEISELYNEIAPYLLNITLEYPLNQTTISDVGTNFTVSGSNITLLEISGDGEHWENVTIYIWNNNDVLVNSSTIELSLETFNETIFIDDFTLGTYKWTADACYVNGADTEYNCTSFGSNYTFYVGATLNNVTYNSEAYETSSQYFSGNITLIDGTELYDVKLVYNGTEYNGDITETGDNLYYIYSTIDIPLASIDTNYSFYFKLIYSIGDGEFLYENKTEYLQLIHPIQISQCSVATNLTLNFTLQNEENLTSLDTWNFLATFEYWIGSGDVKKNVSINNLNINYTALCLNDTTLTYKTDAIIQYEKPGFVKRNYYFYNATLTNASQNIVLYSLSSTAATAFIISVKDGSQLPITDAYIYIQRYYPGTGLFQTVAMSKTDGSGNTVAHFEADTEDYRIIVMKNSEILYTSPIQKVYCSATPCTLPIQTEAAGISGWTKIGNLSNLVYYGPSYNDTTKIVTYTYIDTSGTTHYGRLFVYTISSSSGKQTICNVTSLSNAATLRCNVSGIEGTIYAEGYISRSPEVLVWGTSFIMNTLKNIMGFEGLFWAFLVISILSIGGVLIGGIAGGIIGVIMGMIGSTWLGIAQFGAVTIWGIIVLGIFIIWQIKN